MSFQGFEDWCEHQSGRLDAALARLSTSRQILLALLCVGLFAAWSWRSVFASSQGSFPLRIWLFLGNIFAMAILPALMRAQGWVAASSEQRIIQLHLADPPVQKSGRH